MPARQSPADPRPPSHRAGAPDAFDSAAWSGFDHAYGKASDIPPLLSAAESGDDSAIDRLWGSLCHQGSVYSASYAALPHLLAAARRATSQGIQANLLFLASSVIASNDYRGKEARTADVMSELQGILPAALELTLQTLQRCTDHKKSIYLLAAATTFKGFREIGAFIDGFAQAQFGLACPVCGEYLQVNVQAKGFAVCLDGRTPPPPKFVRYVEPRPGGRPEHGASYHWLVELTDRPALQQVRDSLRFLYGRATCPGCDGKFELIDALIKEHGASG